MLIFSLFSNRGQTIISTSYPEKALSFKTHSRLYDGVMLCRCSVAWSVKLCVSLRSPLFGYAARAAP